MAKIEDVGLEEYYAEFVSVTGQRGMVLIFKDYLPAADSLDALVAEIAVVLDAPGRAAADGTPDGE